MMKKILLVLFLLLVSSNAWAVDWSADASAELILPCDEGSGTDVDDKSANGNTCTYNGAWGNTSMPKAYMDSYLDFDGLNDMVGCGDAVGTDIVANTSDMMLTFWVVDYTNGTAYERFFYRESNSSGDGWQISRNNGTSWYFAVESGGNQLGHQFFTSQEFLDETHYAFLFDWSEYTLDIYEQGILILDAEPVDFSSSFSWVGVDAMNIGARDTAGISNIESHINEIGLFSSIGYDSTDINDIMDNGLVQATATSRRFFLIQ